MITRNSVLVLAERINDCLCVANGRNLSGFVTFEDVLRGALDMLDLANGSRLAPRMDHAGPSVCAHVSFARESRRVIVKIWRSARSQRVEYPTNNDYTIAIPTELLARVSYNRLRREMFLFMESSGRKSARARGGAPPGIIASLGRFGEVVQ